MLSSSELPRLANKKFHQANKYYDYTPDIFTFHRANIFVILEPLPAHCVNDPTQNLVQIWLGSAQMF